MKVVVKYCLGWFFCYLYWLYIILIVIFSDKAKRALKEFLSKDEFYSSKQKTYKRISEDMKNKKAVKVIYVEDEMDKASENRT